MSEVKDKGTNQGINGQNDFPPLISSLLHSVYNRFMINASIQHLSGRSNSPPICCMYTFRLTGTQSPTVLFL